MSKNQKRSTKNLLLSGAFHATIIGALWFAASEMTPIESTPPETIDATILPPPIAPVAVTTEATPIAVPPQLQNKPTEDALPKEFEKSEPKNKTPALTNPTNNPIKQPVGDSEKVAPSTANGTLAPKNKAGSQSSAGKGKDEKSTDKSIPAKATAAIKTPSGVPVAVKIPENAGFNIKYDVFANKGDLTAGGEASLSFKRIGTSYEAKLYSSAAVVKFGATATGEIRNDTLAMKTFKDWQAIKVFGIGNIKPRSDIAIDYSINQMRYGQTGGQTAEVPYSAIYDYLSAMVYLQALLQGDPAKGAEGQHLQLPIAKGNSVGMATVTFKAAENAVSLVENGPHTMIPASIDIASGSITKIDVWFAQDKKYLPLKMVIEFNNGKATLLSRESNVN